MDINFIRTNPDAVKVNQKNRFLDEDIVDIILEVDLKWRQIDYTMNRLRGTKHKIDSAFKKAPLTEIITINTLDDIINDSGKDHTYDFTQFTQDQLKQIVKHINSKLDNINLELKQTFTERNNLIASLGNNLHKDAVISNDEENNKVIYETPLPPNKNHDHIKLGQMLDMIDTENGIKVAGNRGYFLTGMGVKLNMALISYALDFLMERNYKLMQTPHTVNKDLMAQVTQLSEYDETLYKLDGYDKFLIATSEQPLTGYFNKKIIDKASLPLKFGGLSSCYRKEAGKHGHQTLGIYRVHQFEKVEQFCVTTPQESWNQFNDLINTTKDFYDSLGLSYRVISIVSGALNNAASLKYDLEGYFPGSKFYGELVSCTNCLDYFSKRLDTKITETREYVHMLNCTLMANTRVICCLMETYQTDDGMEIPAVLQKYMGTTKINFKNL